MAKKAKDTPETYTVMLANPQRTSAGDPPPDGVVTLPAEEARELIRAGLATLLSTSDQLV
jgi:hypothetical protein